MWVNQQSYVNYSGMLGKYAALNGERSYLIRNVLNNGTSILISADGNNIGSYTSTTSKACGVRKNNEWTMITITYNGSLISYYRNGILCDQDLTTISSIRNSSVPVRLGGGNSISLNGQIDEYRIYNDSLRADQVARLYNESIYGTDLGQSIPVLVYHKVDNNTHESISVTPESFSKQMQYLDANGFNPITLKEYHDWRNGEYELPPRPVILVFDDGWRSVYTNAKPIMDRYGFKGSVAAVMDYSYGSSGGQSYMRWSHLRNLTAQDWSIESHGKSHSHMLTLSESQLRMQLASSKANITKEIGVEPSSFVFPFHEANATYTRICGEYYELCWTQGSPKPSYSFKETPGQTYMGLRRINVVNDTTISEYAAFLAKDSNKAGEWMMEEGSGNHTADSSGNKNHGVLMGGAAWTAQQARAGIFRLLSVADIADPLLPNLAEEARNTIDSDIGKPVFKLIEEKSKWADNEAIEKDEYYEMPEKVKEVKNKTKVKENKKVKNSSSTRVESEADVEVDLGGSETKVKSVVKGTVDKVNSVVSKVGLDL